MSATLAADKDDATRKRVAGICAQADEKVNAVESQVNCAVTKSAEAMAKRTATAMARAALRGMSLRCIEGDNGRPLYVASFHALTRSFSDLAEVETWLDRVDGTREIAEVAA